jgi:GTPase SAR1 family protein
MEHLKCVVLGPPVSGKTSLINTFMSGQYCGYIPHNAITRYDVNFVVAGEEFSKNYFFKIYDYDIFKSNSQQFLKDDELSNIDVIILCFKNISAHRELLLTHFKIILNKKWPSVPILLASSFSDLKNKCSWMGELLDNDSFTSQNFIKDFGASDLILCSSLENSNINDVFLKAFKLALAINKPNEISNTITIGEEEIRKEQLVEDTNTGSSLSIKEDFISKQNNIQDKVFLVQNIHGQNNQTTISLNKLMIPLSFACALMLYLFTSRYCHSNQQHCSEIYDLGMEVYEESVSHLMDFYRNFLKHYYELNI